MSNRQISWIPSVVFNARNRRALFTSIKGQIFIIFSITLVSLTALTLLNYWSLYDVKSRLLLGERYFDFLNSTLEARRFEKNYFLYKDPENLKEEQIYLRQIDTLTEELSGDIVNVIGPDEFQRFLTDFSFYKKAIDACLSAEGSGAVQNSNEIRQRGKALVDFAEQVLEKKKRQIHDAIVKISLLPFAFLAIFILPMLLVIKLISHGLLRPLTVLRDTIKRVATGNYTPAEYHGLQTDEVSRVIWAFNRMAEELAANQENLLQTKKIAALGTFTAGIAHELNNPINNISLTAETYLETYRDSMDEEARELMGDIIAQVDRAGDIVKNLLDFSRSENPRIRPLDPRDVIYSTVSLVKNQIMLAGIELVKEIPERLPKINGNLRNLQQVFMNLLLNAIHATAEGGVITIRVSVDPPGFVRFDVQDTGAGIPQGEMERIFEPFYTTKSVGQGVGLGLSVTFAIVKRHGGRIEVKSEPGRGSTFSVYLPEANKPLR